MPPISTLRKLFDPRLLKAVATPAVGVGVPLLVLLVLQFRALDRLEAAAAAVLRQSGTQLANALAEQIEHDFRAVFFDVLERVEHQFVRELDLDAVRRELWARREQARIVESFFVWGPSTSTDGAASGVDGIERPGSGEALFLTMHDDGGGVLPVSRQPAANGRGGFVPIPRLGALVTEEARRLAADAASYGAAFVDAGDGPRQVVLHLLYASYASPRRRALEAVFGFVVDPAELTRAYFPALVARVRDSHRPPMGMPPLEVTIVDERGDEVYRTGPSLGGQFTQETRFSMLFIDASMLPLPSSQTPAPLSWSVRTGYPGTTVESLIHSETNHQRQLLVLVGVIASVGLVLAGRAMAQEVRLGEMKSEFVASVSHDLKTPLATIAMFAETLETGRARNSEKVEEYGRLIGLEARQLERLIDDMLAFNKIEEGSRQYPMEEIDLRALLRESVDSFLPQLREAGFETRIDLPDDPLTFHGNPGGLTQVFNNLISNAIKYSDDERYLEIRLRCRNGNAVVDVIDHGIGISAAQRPRVFEKFYRALVDPHTEAAGTGLGLAIAAHVVEAHGGRITVESAGRRGSRFQVELPLWFRG